MELVISRHRLLERAEESRKRSVTYQRRWDRIIAAHQGCTPEDIAPPPEDVYAVRTEGSEYVVVYTDPSA